MYGKNSLNENKELMVAHLEEMAQIMLSLAEETRRCIPMGERRFKQIAHALREVGIQIKNLYLIENEMGHMEVFSYDEEYESRYSLIRRDRRFVVSTVKYAFGERRG